MKELTEVFYWISDCTKEEAIEIFKRENYYDPSKQYFIIKGGYLYESGYSEPVWYFYEIKN